MERLVRLLPNVDYKKLPLTPVEGSVFLKIDGKLTEPEIVKATGFHPDTVEKAITRLIELRAAEVVDKAKLAKDQADKTVKAATGLAFGGRLGKSASYDATAMSEAVELEDDRKKTILDAFAALDRLNYYELLGLHQLVDKKEVKAAYYAIAPDFHPDKFFKRNLGSFKARIEAVFARLTLAHDTLSSNQKRREYDEYLTVFEANRRANDLIQGSNAAIAQAQAQIEAEAVKVAEAKKQQDLIDRKRALAAKLGGGRVGPGAKASATPAAPQIPQMDPRQAAEALRVRYEYAKEQAAKAQLEDFLNKGRMALAQNDMAAASNFFRIAQGLAPSDAALQQEAAEVQRVAAVALADNFAKLGEFEASQERWVDAAMNLSKACAGKPDDARIHDRAAYAIFKTSSNPKRAAELARRAVELAPKIPQYRVTLAYCYAAAGLESSAAGELERAAEIGGKDERVVALIQQARDLVKALVREVRERAAQPSAQTPTQGVPAKAPAAPSSHPGAAPQAAVPSHPPQAYPQPQSFAPQSPAQPQGYPQGYPVQGHPAQGQPPQGYPSYPAQGQGYPGQPPQQGWSQQPQQGWPQQPQQGWPQQPQQGWPQQPQQGWPQQPPQQPQQQAWPQQGWGPPPVQGPGQGWGHPPAQSWPPPGPGQSPQGSGYPPSGYPPPQPQPGGYPPNPYGQSGGYPAPEQAYGAYAPSDSSGYPPAPVAPGSDPGQAQAPRSPSVRPTGASGAYSVVVEPRKKT